VSKPGEHYTLNYYVPSLDGPYVAYGVSPSGSEDAVIHVLDFTTGKETGELIDRSWYGGISWLPDGQSFLHVRFQKLPPGADPTILDTLAGCAPLPLRQQTGSFPAPGVGAVLLASAAEFSGKAPFGCGWVRYRTTVAAK
jgi:Prolyl oligopeptidase, N-terminal beta-propeller domain